MITDEEEKIIKFYEYFGFRNAYDYKKDNKENAELWKTNGVMMEDKEE